MLKYALLLTDVVRPRISGKEVAQQLTKMQPGLKVLFMLGYTDEAIMHHGVLDANVQFIQKPFTPAALSKKSDVFMQHLMLEARTSSSAILRAMAAAFQGKS